MSVPEPPTLLALMDRSWSTMWCAITRATRGGWVVEEDGLLLCGSPRASAFGNLALVTGPVAPPALERAVERVYRASGLPFSVATRLHADEALEASLVERGFRKLVDLPGMVLPDGEGTPPPRPPALEIRRVQEDGEREAYRHVMAEAYALYGEGRAATASHFETPESVRGPATQAVLVYEEGRAVAGATLYMTGDVAGIGWVGTLPTALRRGHGAVATWAAVEEGRARGARLTTLQASPMGAPVYRRLGFVSPTQYRVFVPRQ